MKTRFILGLTLCAALIWIGCATDEDTVTSTQGYSGTQISGELTGSLSAGNSPYWVTDDITVPAGESLTIDPGVELRFDGLYKFVVQGHLEAIGTAEENIVFTSMEGALGNGDYGQWRSIVFDTENDVSEMAFCLVQFAAVWDSSERYPIYEDPEELGRWINSAVFIWECSPFIRNCTILYNGYHGIFCLGGNTNPYLLNNNLYDNDGDGIRCETGATADIWYNNSKENNSRQFAECPVGIGEMTTLNANRDPCDFQFNIGLEPDFENRLMQDYDLLSTSALIGAGLDTLNGTGHIGSIPYYVGATELRGPIGGTVITAADSPWYVTNNCFIDLGETLESQSGAMVIFQGIYNWRLAGLFEIDGTTFVHEDSSNSSVFWSGIKITEEADNSSFINDCQFIHASTTDIYPPYGGALTITGSSPTISNNTFTGSEFVAISCQYGAAPEISGNTIDGFGPMGVFCYNNSHPYIHHNVIANGAGYTILCESNSSPHIETNLIYSTSFIGIKCESNSSPFIEYNTIVNHDYSGIQINNQSNPTIENNIIAFNGKYETWSTGTITGELLAELPIDTYSEFTLEFDMYHRLPSIIQQTSCVGIGNSSEFSSSGVYLEIENGTDVRLYAGGTVIDQTVIPSFDSRWQHVKMDRSSDGSWAVTWDEGGANEITLTGSDGGGDISDMHLWVTGSPSGNSIHTDDFTLTVASAIVWQDDFEDGNFTLDPVWMLDAGIGEVATINTNLCLLIKGEEIYGNAIQVDDEYTSLPDVIYNDAYQPEGEGYPFGGVSPDATNIMVDPLFVDLENADFHLQSNSPCKTAASDGGEIGAYGKDSNW